MKGRVGVMGAALIVVSLVLAGAGGAGADASRPSVGGATGGDGGGGTGGVDAVTELGSQLDTTAAHHGWTGTQLRTELLRDQRLRLDGRGGLYYVEPAAGPVTAAPTVSVATATVPQPLTSTFLLHSKPGATKVIYLDFDGHSTSGTLWNNGRPDPIVSGPYDFDGVAGSFSDTEQQRIQYIWARVADDYAAQDVDVTTQDPGLEALRKMTALDTNYGVRVVISDTNWYNVNAGGVAYVGSFNWDSDTPTFVFADQLGNGNEKYVAEAASHEAGHTVGLSHDGTSTVGYYEGQGSWAPIMGVGYYKPVVQWSKGEYAGANNAQDDLAVMANYGVTIRPDDAGNTVATATALSGSGLLSGVGRIERRTDVDVFSFSTGAGPITVGVVPTNPHEPTLDAQARLLNGAGGVVAVSNPASVGSPSIAVTVAAGTYYVEVDGVGEGTALSTGYSDYASLGEYDVTVTAQTSINQPPTAVASVTPTSGTAPLTANYSSAGSGDPDGTIVSYLWSFSDGTTSSAENLTRTYSTAGTFDASLTVTDTDGYSRSVNAPTVVVSAPTQSAGITTVTVSPIGGRKGRATIVVRTPLGAPVVGATVTGEWTGSLGGIQSAVTNSSGTATITSSRGSRGTATFTTTIVIAPPGYTWNGVNKSASTTIS